MTASTTWRPLDLTTNTRKDLKTSDCEFLETYEFDCEYDFLRPLDLTTSASLTTSTTSSRPLDLTTSTSLTASLTSSRPLDLTTSASLTASTTS